MGGGWFFQSPIVSPCILLGTLSIVQTSFVSFCPLSQDQSNSQVQLSKPNREDFKISKRKQSRSLSEYIHIYQSNLQCDFCIPSHLVARPVSRGGLRTPGKTFSPQEKISWTYCMHNHCFRRCYQCKIWASLRKLFIPRGFSSWLQVCWWLLSCDQGRIKGRCNEGNCPGPPAARGPHVMKYICFK